MGRMRLYFAMTMAVCCLFAQEAKETQGMAARATPADYQTQAKAGDVTIAAEFLGHSVPTSENILSTQDFVVVETALYGPPDTRLKLSVDDFSLRINGKKTPAPGEHYVVVFKSLKDPELEPTAAATKAKTSSLSTGGSGNNADNNLPPPVFHIPIGVQRAMEQRVQKASLAEGERPLPQAGLIFFQYRGKPESIHSVELIYSGPAGKTTLTLQP
jgi:hypothetical protein